MPKTYTDDVAPALPSSINGPFQVVDPSDINTNITIDPATGKIATGGAARPVRTLTPGFVNTWGTTIFSQIGVVPARTIASSANGGFYVHPIEIPGNMDVGEASSVRVLIETKTTGPSSSLVIRLKLWYDTVPVGGGTLTNRTVIFDWSTPVDWATTDKRVLIIDNGNGRTFEGSHFTTLDFFGFRIARLGADAADTYTQDIKIAVGVPFVYTLSEY